jgi:hypothetical protein
MNSPEPTPPAGAAALIAVLKDCEQRAAQRDLSLGEVLDSIQDASYAFICILLSLPFLQPLSLGPVAVAGGVTFAALGWQYLRGHHTPVLPQRVRAAVLGPKAWTLMLEVCVRLLGLFSRFSRRRREHWVEGDRGRRRIALIIIAAGLLMALPFFGLPMNNMLPALAIVSVCIAELEQDGIMMLAAIGWLAVTATYFTIVLAILLFAGQQAAGFLH